MRPPVGVRAGGRRAVRTEQIAAHRRRHRRRHAVDERRERHDRRHRRTASEPAPTRINPPIADADDRGHRSRRRRQRVRGDQVRRRRRGGATQPTAPRGRSRLTPNAQTTIDEERGARRVGQHQRGDDEHEHDFDHVAHDEHPLPSPAVEKDADERPERSNTAATARRRRPRSSPAWSPFPGRRRRSWRGRPERCRRRSRRSAGCRRGARSWVSRKPREPVRSASQHG